MHMRHSLPFLLLAIALVSASIVEQLPPNRSASDRIRSHCNPSFATDKYWKLGGRFVSDMLGTWKGAGSLDFVNATTGDLAMSVPLTTAWTIFYNEQHGRVDWVAANRVNGSSVPETTHSAMYVNGGGVTCSVELWSTLGLGKDVYSLGHADENAMTTRSYDTDSGSVVSMCSYHRSKEDMTVNCGFYDRMSGYIPDGTTLSYQGFMTKKDSQW